MNEYKHLEKLKVEILKNKHDGYNIGAVVLDKQGSILNYGFNSYVKTHPHMLYNKYYNSHQIFVHAECDAIYGMGYKVQPHTLIICRLNSKGQYMNSRPCIGCYSEIKKSKIKKVFYTDENGLLTLLDVSIPVDEYGERKHD